MKSVGIVVWSQIKNVVSEVTLDILFRIVLLVS